MLLFVGLGRLRLTGLGRLRLTGQVFSITVRNQFSSNRESVQELLSLWLDWWRDLLLIKGGGGNFITNVDQEPTLQSQAQGYSLREIKGFIQSLNQARQQLEHNANPRLVLEVLMLALPKGKEERETIPSKI